MSMAALSMKIGRVKSTCSRRDRVCELEPHSMRALAAAQRSSALAGHSAVARIALSLVYHHLYRHEESCALAREAMALNPNSPEIVGQAATRLALCGRWDEAAPFLKWATQVDPDHPAVNHLLLALEAYRRNDKEAALAEARRATLSGLAVAFGVLVAICGDLGLKQEASAAIDAACSDGHGLDGVFRELACSIHDEALMRKIRNGLKRAGGVFSARSLR
jgi:hypothetical protein